MDWCRLGTSYYLDAAVLRAGEAAEVLFLRCVAYSAAKESRGRIDKAVLPMLTPSRTQARVTALVREELLIDEGTTVLIRSWDRWQEALDVEADRRRKDRDRKAEERQRRRLDGHEVYRLYRADDALLYVGQTWDLLQRMRDHSVTKWWADVAYCTLQRVADADEACEVERMAIELEQPIRNISRGNLSPAGWQAQSRDRGLDLVTPVQAVSSRKEVEVDRERTRTASPSPRDLAFEEFWLVYPRKIGKGAARKAWDKAVKLHGADVVMAGALRFARQPGLEERFTPHPSTWLNAERWLDQPHAAPSENIATAWVREQG